VNRVVAPAELLPACRALAKDMLSCDPDVLKAYKRVIDDGYADDVRRGLRIEGERNREHAEDGHAREDRRPPRRR
jgi:enoyl-CoA hydratase